MCRAVPIAPRSCVQSTSATPFVRLYSPTQVRLYAISKEKIYSEIEEMIKEFGREFGQDLTVTENTDVDHNEVGLTVKKEGEIPGLRNLPAICASAKSKPDFVVIYCEVPVMVIELQSPCKFENAIRQTYLYVFDHLRLLRNISTTFKKWSGYLYAKPSKRHQCPEKEVNGCVTRVDIKWLDEELAFEVTFKPLKLDEYKANTKKHLKKQIDDLRRHLGAEKPPLLFGIPLSEGSITFLNTKIAAAFSKTANPPVPKKLKTSLEQWPSLTSIIVADKDWVFKYIFSVVEEKTIRDLREFSEEIDVSDCQFLFPDPKRFRISDKAFFRYPRLPAYPMSKEEVRECFHDYAKSVSEALSSMHNLLKYAHCDVRMENIVFKEKEG